ncbi:putative ubiquitin-like-specific protease 1B [Zea mays]|uniref:ATP-dependent DNA helicase n=1 Tax=Zea mays TaxID=4577 RepID=A0A3L6FFE4_MAIZE|nr:putative ubiquitin-like-specific protease 1B [Zea mays]
MTVEQKNEKSRKRREVSQRNKGLTIQPEASRGDEKVSLSDGCSTIDFTNFATQVPNVNQDDDSDWLHSNETFKADDVFTTRDLLTPGGVHETVGNTPNHNLGRVAYFRERPLRRKQHVPRGERQAILARRNRQFEASISRNMATATKDTISDAEEGDDWTQPHMSAKINNNVQCRIQCHGAIVATNESASMTEQGSGVDHTQSKPRVISNVDDDDSVVFEDDADENEGYLFAGQYEDTDEDIEIDGSQDESTATDVPDPYDKVYSNIPEETHMLKTVPNCGYCTAKKFEYETPGFCCRGGKVELAPLETPPQLKRLWDSADSDARHFRDNIMFFNGHFSFTSLYCCLDSMTTNGMMYHNIKSFGREGGAEHKHLELYFYDDDPTLEHRYSKCREEHQHKDKEVIRQIVDILHGNPYSEHLRTMGHVENLDDYRITLNLDQTLNQKTYNTPLTSKVAAVWIEGSEGRGQFSKSVMLLGKDSSSHCIRSSHGCYDALSYLLFFPRGELGWHANIPKVGVSMDEVDAYRATHRASNANDEDAVSPWGIQSNTSWKAVFQQFAVDTYIKIDSSRLDYIRRNQDRLRADLYQGLVDSMLDGDIRVEKVGKRTVLSTSFIGGPRDMRRRYMDAMALVRKFGKPDIFLTMTCNHNWDEIRRELLPGQTPQDRPDLVVCVFHAKLQELKHRLTKQDILGKVRAYVYVVEFQKRGLPHAHFLLIMQRKYKLTCLEQYDLLISAEIPSNKYPELRKMGRKSCKNHYPRPFSDTTLQGKDSYPIYRRRDDDRKENVRGCELDNRWVVPYNPYLLRLFNYHINVEACGSIKAVKYLFKYIYKGHDRASVVMRDASKADDDVDEIKQYRDARWVTPPEALWRIYGFELSQISPPVMQLQLHLPNMHMVVFHERQMVERVVNRPGVDRSMLTTYFEVNRLHEEARGILYRDFPKWYTWQSGKGKMPSALRRLFATILVYCEPSDVAVLWQKHKDSMSEDYQHRSQNKTHVEQMVLIDIRNMLQSMGKDIKTFPLPPIIDAYDDAIGTAREGKIAVATATSGVAASIMPGGRTAHPRFKIPLTIDDGAVRSFTKQSGTAELLRKASLIIWDEASMTKRQAVEALDNSMRDIMGRPALPFGGKTIVFGGDFRQVLPIVHKGSRAQVVASSLRMSYLWESMSHLKLVSNMRAKNDPWFAEFLLRVGGGTEETNSDGDIRLLDDMIDRFQGEHMVYHSFDSAMDDPHNYYPPEFLNTLTPNGLPPHVLKLKIGCHVILLRNIDPANGLCNGTRLVIRGFQRNSIDAEIVLGQHVGKRIFLPRIPLCPSDEEMFPFQFKRKQFPVRLSFAMTVNKAQGFCLARMESLFVGLFHNKPKKSVATAIVREVLSHDWLLLDYICTQGDLALIDFIKEIPCEPRVEVMLIDDAFVERKWMECLFQPNAYLGDEVIVCYINLIKAQKHLKCRSGGRVHIENAFQFNFLKRDGDVEIKTEELYPIKDMTQICSAERRVLLYLDHDMVFIPINIRETHWYLAIIHARNMEIQVLDSLGSSQDRKDLTDSIKGLQRQIDMISQRKELKDHRWPDLQVASWPLREIDMGYAKQTDSSSCGLFLLNYIEYWTGDELSDSFTQDDMSHFRKKMAAILLSSDLNKRRGCLLYKNEKEVDSGSPSDVEILENPTDSNKRKLIHVLDDSEVVYEDEEGSITQADLQRWFVDDWDKRAHVKVSTDGCTNDFLMVGLSTKDMSVTKADSVDVLCDYIMAIEDDTTLECFDMAVRLLANKESRRPKEEIINNRKHYMDMRFWRMVGFGKLPKYHQDPITEELAKTLDCWPSMNYYITGCRYVLMPWKFNGCHTLFVIDHVKKHVTFIDFTPTQDWCKHMPYKRFNTSYLVLQAMAMWGNDRRLKFVGIESLRRFKLEEEIIDAEYTLTCDRIVSLKDKLIVLLTNYVDLVHVYFCQIGKED